MLDYEVLGYKVEFRYKDGTRGYKSFKREDEAIMYIDRNLQLWSDFRLLKTQTAIIEIQNEGETNNGRI